MEDCRSVFSKKKILSDEKILNDIRKVFFKNSQI